MGVFEEFERYVGEGLAHLYDPTYQPPELIWQVTGCNPKQGIGPIQTRLIQAVEGLKPEGDTPPNARIWRYYELLSDRYIHELTQVETARRLNITPRHLRREQQQAIHMLAQRLWEQRPQTETLTVPAPEAPPTEWRSQVRQELVSLQQHAPGAVTKVEVAIQGAAKAGLVLAANHKVALQVDQVQPNLVAAIHPSILSQLLMTAIEKLVQDMSSGDIILRAEGDKERIKITIAGYPMVTPNPQHSDLIEEILTLQDGSVEVQLAENRAVFEIALPSASSITVLVIDDNVDLVHFYRRYTTQTRYQIVHLASGQGVFETIAETTPDIIVLDVMLPDVDGWELLTHLHEHPNTRAIPIIVCSVVKREELALALGAALYLPKPVRRQQFIQALDQIHREQALAAGPTALGPTKA